MGSIRWCGGVHTARRHMATDSHWALCTCCWNLSQTQSRSRAVWMHHKWVLIVTEFVVSETQCIALALIYWDFEYFVRHIRFDHVESLRSTSSTRMRRRSTPPPPTSLRPTTCCTTPTSRRTSSEPRFVSSLSEYKLWGFPVILEILGSPENWGENFQSWKSCNILLFRKSWKTLNVVRRIPFWDFYCTACHMPLKPGEILEFCKM